MAECSKSCCISNSVLKPVSLTVIVTLASAELEVFLILEVFSNVTGKKKFIDNMSVGLCSI